MNTGEINDLSVSNNGDSEKVLATVVSAIYAFTDLKPESWIYASGSTKSRTRLYRMGINRYFDKVNEDFDLFGLYNKEFLRFAFSKLLQKKIIISPSELNSLATTKK